MGLVWWHQRKTEGGNSGEGKTSHKAPTQKKKDPPTYDTFLPPLCSRPVIFLRGEGRRPAESNFLRPPKLVLQGALYVSPPPQNRTILGQKSCRTKLPRIFRIFVLNLAPNFAPNFPRIFRDFFVLRFVGETETWKNHQKAPPFFNAKFPGKHEQNIHKMFLESRQRDTIRFAPPLFCEFPMTYHTCPLSTPPLPIAVIPTRCREHALFRSYVCVKCAKGRYSVAYDPTVRCWQQNQIRDSCYGLVLLKEQLKGKIIPALFHTFWHFPSHFHTFLKLSSRFFLELRGLTTVLVQRDKKR